MVKKVALSLLMIAGTLLLPFAQVFAEPGLEVCQNTGGVYTEAELAEFGCSSDVNAGKSIVGIINAFIAVLGILAVIMIIIGGIWYVVSQGDPTRAKRGRDTIIFSIFGLIMALLAYAIVNFALGAL